MALFSSPKRNTVDENTLLDKVKNSKKSQPTLKLGKDSLLSRINNIKTIVEEKLGKYKNNYRLVNDKKELNAFIDKVINYGYCSIDTETTGLNCFKDKVVGVSIYIPTEKSIYIPLRHISYITGELSNGNMNIDDFKECFKRLENSNVKIIYQNAKFDYKMVYNDLKIKLPIYYDTLLASRALNQTESADLKFRYSKYVEQSDEFFRFSNLFGDIPFQYIPINVGYIYGAKDPEMTYKLYEYQLQELKDKPRLKWLLFNIEFPCILATIELELNGVLIDKEYANNLHIKYQKLLDYSENKAYDELNKFNLEIESYKRTHINHKLTNPINLSSPTQLAVLFYDIFNLPIMVKKEPRGTGEEILLKWQSSNSCIKYKELFNCLLEYRANKKLMTTYIDAIPSQVEDDGRIHCQFNQYGADTGRFSSSEPNLQNIPSQNTDIRPMFTSAEGNCLISSDFSQQEVRLMAVMSADTNMIQAYKENKDIYAWVASIIYRVPYEECKEFRPDGSVNKEGKKRRNHTKAIVLGINYGKTPKSIATDLGITEQEAENIYNTFLNEFPNVRTFIKTTQAKVKQLGYTETLFGRRRYLPDMQLEDIELKRFKPNQTSIDPTDFDNEIKLDYSISNEDKKYWINRYNKAFGIKQKQLVIQDARNEGIELKDNTLKKQDAERQCVNSVIQGTASDQVKISLIALLNNQELKDLGFKLCITVHDEILGECPIINAKRCAEIITNIMIHSIDKYASINFKCDAEFVKSWYGEKMVIE